MTEEGSARFDNVDLILQVPDGEGNLHPTVIKGYSTDEDLITTARRDPTTTKPK
jgi:hypothetical protein